MTQHGPSPTPDELVARLVSAARDRSGGDLSAREQAGVYRLERALLRNGHGQVRLRSTSRVLWLLPIALAAILGGVAMKRALHAATDAEHAITFQVVSAKVADGGYISSDSPQAAVRFSDQSDLGLAVGTRMRISHLEVRGAHVMLEGGALHVRIHPQPRASWTLNAGPYVVHVTGTEFDLAWRGDEQTLDLQLHKGSVVVEGPLAAGGVKVDAGQHLIANTKAGSLSLVDELNAASRSPDAVGIRLVPASQAAGGRSAPVSPSRVAPTAPTGPAGARAEELNWNTRVAHGDFDGVIEDADRRGIDKVLVESTPVELAALADAARYARRRDVAKRALTAERSRYPDSLQARDAPFFLGSIDEAQKNDAAAIEWYDVYLRESADGAYASQALGRKMVLAQRIRDFESARAIATAYLARFPDGPYASSARKLLQSQ